MATYREMSQAREVKPDSPSAGTAPNPCSLANPRGDDGLDAGHLIAGNSRLSSGFPPLQQFFELRCRGGFQVSLFIPAR